MIHSYFKDKISAYKDLGLNLEETQLIQEHLNDCAECQELLERLNSLDRMVERESTLDSGEYWEKLAQKIDGRIADKGTKVTEISKSRSSSGLLWKITATAASLAFLVFIGIHKDDILSPSVSDSEAPLIKESPEVARELRSAETDVATFPGDVDSRSRANETEKQEISGTRDEAATLEKSEMKLSVSKPVLVPKSTRLELLSEESPTILGESEAEPLSDADSKDVGNYKLSVKKTQSDGVEVKNETVHSSQSPVATIRSEDLLEQFSEPGVLSQDSALNDWRKERDNILLSLPQYRLAFDDKQSSKRTKAKSSVSGDADINQETGTAEKNIAVNEIRLLELLISILAATENKIEADSALAIIQFMATRGGSEIREAANEVIDSIESRSVEESKFDN